MHQITHIGLDVHKDTIAEAVRRLLSRYPDPSQLSTCYEAGPTGYDTHRLITSLEIACDVIAPSRSIPLPDIPQRQAAIG